MFPCEFDQPEEILVGDGEHINAEGKGWVFFHGTNSPKVIRDVLYVPKMAANLFSVKAALKEVYEISFTKGQVTVRHEHDLIESYYDGCLFVIELEILNKLPCTGAGLGYILARIVARTIRALWHRCH